MYTIRGVHLLGHLEAMEYDGLAWIERRLVYDVPYVRLALARGVDGAPLDAERLHRRVEKLSWFIRACILDVYHGLDGVCSPVVRLIWSTSTPSRQNEQRRT